MGKRSASERPPHERPQRDKKVPLRFSPDAQTGTARVHEVGENQYPRWQTESRGADYGGAPGSPTQRPMQDQSNADRYVLDTQASQPDGGRSAELELAEQHAAAGRQPAHPRWETEYAPWQGSAYPLPGIPQHSLLGTQQRHALYDAPHAPPQLTLQAANGRQTPAQAQGGLLQAGHCGWHSSQHLRGQQLEAYQPPVEEMTDQQLETALRDTQWEEAFANKELERRARVNIANELLRRHPLDSAQLAAEHTKDLQAIALREKNQLEAELERQGQVEAGLHQLGTSRGAEHQAGSLSLHSQEEPSAGGDWLRNQQQRATPRAGATQLHTGQQKAARRKYAPLYDSPADTESSEEESSEDDDEKNRALQEEQDMQDYNGEDEEDEPARPKKKKGTAAQHARAAFLPQDQELETLETRGLLRCMMKSGAAYHAENQATLGELVAAVKKGSVARPSAGKGESASKAMSKLVGKRLREVSYYPSDDDYEHMAALRLKCKDAKEALARSEGSAEEVNILARQAWELARRTYRAPAITECKKAICSWYPEAFTSNGKDIIPAQAGKFREKRYRTGAKNEESDDYGEPRYREALLQAYKDVVPGNADPAKITHLTASQLALMELVADRLFEGKMVMPSYNKSLTVSVAPTRAFWVEWPRGAPATSS